ncbi:MAG TPA: CapA family protein [Tepidisphaeraceae bacterium]|nr:CapA family protein [Tepidisphaeraceae bacterium]
MTFEFISSPKSDSGAKADWTALATGDFGVEVATANPLGDRQFEQLISPEVRSVFASSEISLVNLEAPLSGGVSAIAKVGPAIALDPRSIDLLSNLGVKVATLANNHGMDFGPTGLESTIHACNKARIETTGGGRNRDQAMKSVRLTTNNFRVSILSFCEAEFGIACEDSAGTAGISEPQALAAVMAEREQSDVLIVAAHGGVEFSPLSPIQRARQLRSFIDAGADCVIGNHPHVPQAWEFYRSGLIFHSLGNFLFRLNSGTNPMARWSLMPRIHFRGKQILGFEAIAVALDSAGCVKPSEGYHAQIAHLKRLSQLLSDWKNAEQLWLSAAMYLWDHRYRGLMSLAQGSITGRVRSFLRRLRSGERGGNEAAWRKMLLLNLLRAESHRWTIESAQMALLDPPSLQNAGELADLFNAQLKL